MIKAITQNLEEAITLMQNLTDAQYSNRTVPPYYSSIGDNIRHVLDIFTCIFNGLPTQTIDFSDRKRNEYAQLKTSGGITYCNEIITHVKGLLEQDFNKPVLVIDDLGTGRVAVHYTLAAALCQAHNHALHHFASIGFILQGLHIQLPSATFGYNPTTPII